MEESINVATMAGSERRPIVLTTINARHSHAALGLRYLKANAGDLATRIRIEELVLGADLDRMVERLLAAIVPEGPRLIGLGIYIWNVVASTELCRRLRARAPDIVLVLGGPEVSHEIDQQPIAALADHVIQGPGDLAFARLARGYLYGPRPLQKIIAGEQPADLGELALPYPLYDDNDIARRHLYVEASRGCPFKCAFCLSALDRTAWPFPVEPFLAALDQLWQRGARTFRFVDRTFNLRLADSVRILDFFLERITATPDDPCQVHFELIPDRLPPALREPISRFPAGTLQFEIGIQSFNPSVQKAIDRRQDNDEALANLHWLRENSQAHLHVDLIAGLPGEDLESFAAGFDRLHAARPHEIQLGLLKRLRGAPIIRHELAGRLAFDPEPPYGVTRTDALTADEVVEFRRLADFHNRVVNGGRMPSLAAAILERPGLAGGSCTSLGQPPSPFARMRALSASLHASFGRSHGISFEALVDAVRQFAVDAGILNPEEATALAVDDYQRSGAHGRLACMPRGIAGNRKPVLPGHVSDIRTAQGIRFAAGWTRQRRHQVGGKSPDLGGDQPTSANERLSLIPR